MTIDQLLANGFTERVILSSGTQDLEVLVHADTDFDSRFKAWCLDGLEFIQVNGWMIGDIEHVGDA